MEQTWLRQEGNADLIIFMLGWAANPNAVCHLELPGYDILACYDHRSMAPLRAEDFSGYRRIYLYAWSFGVWVAEQCCRELPLYRAVALNGTPFPVDKQYGMRLRVVQRSMRAIANAGGINSFQTASQEGARYIPGGPFPERSAQDKLAELDLLAEWSGADSAAHLRWDAAYIGDKDEIFPPANMRAYWHSVGLGTEFASFHYPFADFATIAAATLET